jgi:hypothetical protein
MRRFYILTNMNDSLLDCVAQLMATHNLKESDDFEVDVFDEEERLLTVLRSDQLFNQGSTN